MGTAIIVLLVVAALIFLLRKKTDNTSPLKDDSKYVAILKAAAQLPVQNENVYNNSKLEYFLGNKVGYFSQAKNKEDAIFISRLVAPNGNHSKWTDFRNKVLERIPEYDTKNLRFEYDSFYGMAQLYQLWHNSQKDKDVLPYLKYDAVSDGNTCKTCKKLHGIIRPVDDAFWDTYFPPNCEECRCVVLSLDKFDKKVRITDLSKKKLIPPEPMFALNIGKHDLKLPY